MTLAEYQELVRKRGIERGFNDEGVSETMMLLTEEVGELAKACRKLNGVKVDKDSKLHDVGEEAADVLFVLLQLCNLHGIRLDEAFAAKEAKNQKRQWT